MTISLIVPVYNAAASLGRCLDSIKAQSYKDLELCFVDDFSTDGSLQMLEDFKSAYPGKVVILLHEENKGVAAARNTGLDSVTGDYVAFLDADDTLMPDAFSTASRADADVIGWDWILAQQGSERYMKQLHCTQPEDVLKSLMNGTMRWNLWLFLVRRNLYEGVRFIPGQNMGEDMMVMMRIMMRAASFQGISKALYRYEQTGSSVSRSMTESNISQVSANLALAGSELESSKYSYLADPYMNYLKQTVKLPLLVSPHKTDWKRWAQWYPESDKDIMSNKSLPLRTRILQHLGSRHCWIGISLYNTLYKLAYRLMYRS